MKLKHIESALSSLTREFDNPKVDLEQYPTSAHLAASIVLMACNTYGDIGRIQVVEGQELKQDEAEDIDYDENAEDLPSRIKRRIKYEYRTCCDLGCGTGMLSMAVALMGCPYILSVDCDADALSIAQENAQQLFEENEDLFYGEYDNDGNDDDNDDYEPAPIIPTIEFLQAQLRMSPNSHKSLSSGGVGGRGGRGGGRGGRRGGKGGRGKGRGGKGGRGKVQQVTDSSENHDGCSPEAAIPTNDGIPLPDNCIDTVITNPPFGTKDNAGIDVQFVSTGIRLAKRAVFSFHKTSTRNYLLKYISSNFPNKVESVKVVAQMKFDIPQMYKFHKQKSVDVEVDLIRVSIKET